MHPATLLTLGGGAGTAVLIIRLIWGAAQQLRDNTRATTELARLVGRLSSRVERVERQLRDRAP
jgi:hypothetical protein